MTSRWLGSSRLIVTGFLVTYFKGTGITAKKYEGLALCYISYIVLVLDPALLLSPTASSTLVEIWFPFNSWSLAAVWTKRGWDAKGVEHILGDISERGMVNSGGGGGGDAHKKAGRAWGGGRRKDIAMRYGVFESLADRGYNKCLLGLQPGK